MRIMYIIIGYDFLGFKNDTKLSSFWKLYRKFPQPIENKPEQHRFPNYFNKAEVVMKGIYKAPIRDGVKGTALGPKTKQGYIL